MMSAFAVSRIVKISAVLSAGIILAACASAPPPTPTAVAPSPQPAVVAATAEIVGINQEPTGTIIANLPTGIPTVAQTNTPMPPPPTITSSGPMLSESQNNAMAFTTAVPDVVGPFTLVKNSTILSQYGVTLQYRTEDGQIYQVVLWITQSAQEAATRYTAEVSAVQGQHTLKLGDEAVYSMADINLLAVIRYRNVVIDVHRPENPGGTVPLQSFTDDQIQTLLQKLFAALPPMGA